MGSWQSHAGAGGYQATGAPLVSRSSSDWRQTWSASASSCFSSLRQRRSHGLCSPRAVGFLAIHSRSGFVLEPVTNWSSGQMLGYGFD